jgi:predicted house-cleaning NTP pyrophosphatase (Maf/HAM1 superfamily)
MTDKLTKEQRAMVEEWRNCRVVIADQALAVIDAIAPKPKTLGEVARSAYCAMPFDRSLEAAWEAAANAVKEALHGPA